MNETRPPKKSSPTQARAEMKTRLFVVSALLALYGGALMSRLFYLQVLQHDALLTQSEKQYYSTSRIYYGRGSVMDRNRSLLATNLELESVYINPREIEEKRTTARRLAAILDLDPQKILKKVSSEKQFVWLKRKCPIQETEKLRKLRLPGVYLVEEHRRFYPKRELAAHTIGFVGLDNQGLSGVEQYYQTVLKGTTSLIVMEKDARGRQIRFASDPARQSPVSNDLMLTIDEIIQFDTEYQLKQQVEKYKAKSGMAVVMNPQTGEIYAMATVPQYNPNNYAEYAAGAWSNPVVAGAFEPGSIFKPILAAAAIDAGSSLPTDTFFCENGSYFVGKTKIGEASGHEYGNLTLTDILAKSSNIGAAKVGQKLGKDVFYGYIKKFGFGEKAGIDLPGEAVGKLRSLDTWTPLSLATVSFGHEIAVTPIQMITALSAIANGGNLMRPHVTKAILRNGVIVQTYKPELVRRVISEKTSRLLIDMLKEVVKDGTGTQAAVEGFDVAGKTGTAQKMDPETQTYSKTKFLSSFVGFVPAEAPKLAILVMVDEPQGVHYGGQVAAPVFREIAKQTLRYLNVPSTEERVFILDHA